MENRLLLPPPRHGEAEVLLHGERLTVQTQTGILPVHKPMMVQQEFSQGLEEVLTPRQWIVLPELVSGCSFKLVQLDSCIAIQLNLILHT